ncbi:MAG: sigma-70 family RNA polymerase sigma factor [Gemmatimonadetes bacterium]|nr:sigma-70 family RNA polymerase sigma factor [Gemmatimonadota bacterium]
MKALGDADLVGRARAGVADAFGEIVARYMRAAYAVALSVTRRHEDAEDAAQEAFVVSLERLDECRDPDRFAGWLLTIVRNRSLNLVRRESLRAASPLPPDAEYRSERPDRMAERRELRDGLLQALSVLPEVQQAVVLLHDLEGFTHREIAQRLKLPAGTVRSHLHFARQRLRTRLQAHGEP